MVSELLKYLKRESCEFVHFSVESGINDIVS